MTATDPVAHIPPFNPQVLREVAVMTLNEINRQDFVARAGGFGGTHILPGGPDPERMVVLTEEMFEAMLLMALERVNQSLNAGQRSDGYRRVEGLKEELIQVAACATAWVAAIIEERD